MPKFFTTGQVARQLHVSISTLKRWLTHPELKIKDYRNYNGWRLFTVKDVEVLKKYKRFVKKNGKNFTDATLMPVESITK